MGNVQISLLNAKDNTNININTPTSNPKTNQYNNKSDSMFNPKPDSMFNNANMPPSMFLNSNNNNDTNSQMSKEMSELDKQIKAKNAMQNILQTNSKGFDLPASLRMGSSYTDKFKQRNINKTE